MPLQDRIDEISKVVPREIIKNTIGYIYKKDLKEKYRKYKENQSKVKTILIKGVKHNANPKEI